MKTFNCRETAKRIIGISRNELNQLCFWAKVGVEKFEGTTANVKSKGGSYWPEIKQTIKDFQKI